MGLREDLLETVLSNTTSAGFQTEKYEDMFLRLSWSAANLKQVAEKRVDQLFKDQYTNSKVKLSDILAKKVGDTESFEYILERSLYRPRDVIVFLNDCIQDAKWTVSH